MPKLTDKERVLQYILSQDIETSGKLYLGINSYVGVKGLSADNFIKQLIAIEYEKRIAIFFHGQKRASAPVTLTVFPPTLTYFEDKKKARMDRIVKSITLTFREIVLIALGAIFGGAVTYVITIITTV